MPKPSIIDSYVPRHVSSIRHHRVAAVQIAQRHIGECSDRDASAEEYLVLVWGDPAEVQKCQYVLGDGCYSKDEYDKTARYTIWGTGILEAAETMLVMLRAIGTLRVYLIARDPGVATYAAYRKLEAAA